ncbi:hypothetical protein [Legionella waltersii]|uniref:Uncharacterized protein n=1 Tax=Legionella waltersii TaxID=66969 RepID=A0A0W1AB17_9GAMM|nr:hypothetical protein [Legionella waltersii]KTD78468.1 hypothetical protein Lwal_1903 [Legionella waltersii]SNV05893.1 Uncharacterised protein [Legionella waltersii]
MPNPIYEVLQSMLLDDRLLYDEEYASEKLPCGLTNLQFAAVLLLTEYELPSRFKQKLQIDPAFMEKRRSKIVSRFIQDASGNLELNELVSNLAQSLFIGAELDLTKELMLNKKDFAHKELAECLRQQLIQLKKYTYHSRHHQEWEGIHDKIRASKQSPGTLRLSLSDYSHVSDAAKANDYLGNIDDMIDAALRHSTTINYSPAEQFVLSTYRYAYSLSSYQFRLEEDCRREMAKKNEPLLYVAIKTFPRNPMGNQEPLLNTMFGNTIKQIAGGMHASVLTNFGSKELREVHILMSGPFNDSVNVDSILRNDVFEVDLMAMITDSMKELLSEKYGSQWQSFVQTKFREVQQNVYADALVQYAHIRAIQPKSYQQLKSGIVGHLFGRNTFFASTTRRNEELRAQKLYNADNPGQQTEMLCSEFVCLTLNTVFNQLNHFFQNELNTDQVVVRSFLPETEITDYVTPARLIELITQSGCARKVSLSEVVDAHIKLDGDSNNAPV